MQNQQPNENKLRNLSVDNINLSNNYTKPDSQAIEDNKLKKQNKYLRKQLENISFRLDSEIKKRFQENKKKRLTQVQEVSFMELQNAYKKCQIYKKQILFYKKKIESMEKDDRIQEVESKLISYVKENHKLKEQIKNLKKISKLQEKGLVQMGSDGYTKVVAQNQKLNEQIKILKKLIDENRRKNIQRPERLQKISKNTRQRQESSFSKYQVKITEKDIKFQEDIKKRIRTQQNKGFNQEELSDVLQVKVQKDFQKIRSLISEKNKLRDMVDNLKLQLASKEKENIVLKEKVNSLKSKFSAVQEKNHPRIQSFDTVIQLQKQENNNYKYKMPEQKISNRGLHIEKPSRLWKSPSPSTDQNLPQQQMYAQVKQQAGKSIRIN